uniref:ISXO2-like transposase domain-containing protein n=1 Tax=Ditylenchus dipsaci TaxID=166011 RepID=A0A915E4Y5_9BILA
MGLTKICDEIAISSEAAVKWSRFCRRAVYYGMISLGESIGGPGDVAVHTNSIEASWGAVRRMIFRQPGSRTRLHLPGNLAKYLLIKQCGFKIRNFFKE